MAIKRTQIDSRLAVKYAKGTDDKGNDIIKGMNFSNLDLEATPEALYAFGSAIEGLLNYSVTGFEQKEDAELTQVADA